MYHGACRVSEEYTRAVHVGALNPTGIRSVVPRIASTALHTARCPLCRAQSPAPCDFFPCPQDSPRPPTRPTILEAMEPRLPKENLLHCLGADDLVHFGALGHHLHLLVLGPDHLLGQRAELVREPVERRPVLELD